MQSENTNTGDLLELSSTGTSLIVGKLQGWWEHSIKMLPNFVVAVLVILVFYFISKLVRLVLSKTLARVSDNKGVNQLLVSASHVGTITIGIFVSLEILNMDKAVTSLLASVGIIGLALGFAFQDAAANLVGGIALAVNSPLKIGDIVELDGHFGTIQQIGLRTTVLQVGSREIVIPNSKVMQGTYIHRNPMKKARLELVVGVSYGEDLGRVEKLTLEALSGLDFLERDRPPRLYFTEFGESSINFTLVYWVAYTELDQDLLATHKVVKALKQAYDANGVTIPFPIRTLDFGIKGGQDLRSMLGPR